MDVSTISMTTTQLTLIWILLACLFGWALFFTLLALRPEPSPSKEKANMHTAYTPPQTPPVAALSAVPAFQQPNTGKLSEQSPLEVSETETVQASF